MSLRRHEPQSCSEALFLVSTAKRDDASLLDAVWARAVRGSSPLHAPWNAPHEGFGAALTSVQSTPLSCDGAARGTRSRVVAMLLARNTVGLNTVFV